MWHKPKRVLSLVANCNNLSKIYCKRIDFLNKAQYTFDKYKVRIMEIQQTQIPPEITKTLRELDLSLKRTAEQAIKLGGILSKLKEQAQKANISFQSLIEGKISEKMAYNFLNAYKQFNDVDPSQLGNIQLNVLYSTTEELKPFVLEAAENQKVTRELFKEIKASRNGLVEMAARQDRLDIPIEAWKQRDRLPGRVKAQDENTGAWINLVFTGDEKIIGVACLYEGEKWSAISGETFNPIDSPHSDPEWWLEQATKFLQTQDRNPITQTTQNDNTPIQSKKSEPLPKWGECCNHPEYDEWEKRDMAWIAQDNDYIQCRIIGKSSNHAIAEIEGKGKSIHYSNLLKHHPNFGEQLVSKEYLEFFDNPTVTTTLQQYPEPTIFVVPDKEEVGEWLIAISKGFKDELINEAIIIIPVDTIADWWVDLEGYICFLKSEPKALAYWGNNEDSFTDYFGDYGVIKQMYNETKEQEC